MIDERAWSTIWFGGGVWGVAIYLFVRALRRAMEHERKEHERSE
jgi:hypothetical protein